MMARDMKSTESLDVHLLSTLEESTIFTRILITRVFVSSSTMEILPTPPICAD